ncbi:Phage-related baseplate assembly protein [Vibrio aerogenes CECT 7868]|uniref:Phage-related baseplate assembly protein n=1 Tax=Vibrio aerogenes CECT 7868 TaxID=1216006 RepID=A0A1M5Y2S2_9VIBR|nr:type VI secretion system tip protein TssI/VgrG [Vibrio aerogenes]SHI06098.1 Phage-related baseplate assembly protein [Vibrio aerogenes CECT 7868]
MKNINFQLTIDGVNDETLVVTSFDGDESVSDATDSDDQPLLGYRYTIQLASRSRFSLPVEKVLDSKALLEIVNHGKVIRKVHGVIRSFTRGDTGHHHTFYTITLVPSLERLSLRVNCRIFQHKSAQDILMILLEEAGITDFCFDIRRTLAVREYCVQYRESDLTFFHRLAAEEGLMYMFIHEADKHGLVITDHERGFPVLEGQIPYNALSGGSAPERYIASMTERQQSEMTTIEMRDYSFKKPDYDFSQCSDGVDTGYQETFPEYFEFPGRYKDAAAGKAFARIRLEYFRREAHTAQGKSNATQIQAGLKCEVTDHHDERLNRLWLAVKVRHTGSQPRALEEEGTGGSTDYRNEFTFIPGDQVWRAETLTKPRVDGPVIARVTGPENGEIFMDESGRVKLHFFWDRYSHQDDKSSCWVRVSQGWAGAQQGMVTVPRVGNEVIVSFLHGDPDQPIVTGRTFDISNTPPYSLPAHKTKTVLRSQTHQGQGYNELSFEDQAGTEKIYLHAQRDYETLIENNAITEIGHHRHETIENDRFTSVGKIDHQMIEGIQCSKISKNRVMIAGQEFHQKVKGKQTLESGSEVHLKGGSSVVLQAGSELTVKVGGTFLKLDPAGVHVVGPAINLNSGGSAGSGSGWCGQEPGMPKTPESVKVPEAIVSPEMTAGMETMTPELFPVTLPVIQQALTDIQEGMAITQTCQKTGDICLLGDDCPCKGSQS